MSYDLRIYTIKKQKFNGIKNQLNAVAHKNEFILPIKDHQVVITKETPIEDEDIPTQISGELPGLKYLIECNLQPITSNPKHIKELIGIAKIITKEGTGVIEDQQSGEIILPSGINRVLEIEKTERFSIVELSWWFNDNSILEKNNLKQLLETIERYLPEALPRRYGEYEPPKEKFKDIDTFCDYFISHSKESVVWYPTKPVVAAGLRFPEFIGPTSRGYRFGHFSISIDSAVLDMPGWPTTIERLFKNVSEVLNPFYGDIYIIKNYIRGRNTLFSDGKTERHPISSWWWNGIPRERGVGLLIGEPLLSYVKIRKPTFILNNKCEILIDSKFNKISPWRVKIKNNILQPRNIENNNKRMRTFVEYPKLWPFDELIKK
jgi:hypothetical protein